MITMPNINQLARNFTAASKRSWGSTRTVQEPVLVFLGALYLVFFTNRTLLRFIFNLDYGASLDGILFKISAVILAISLMHILLLVFFTLNISRVALVVFAFLGSAADFFMLQYGVLVSSSLIAGLFETTRGEASQFLSWAYLFALIIFGGLFSVLIWSVKLKPLTWKVRISHLLKLLAIHVAIIALIASLSFKEYASFFRNNRQVRHMFNPVNSLYETFRYFKGEYFPKNHVLVRVGLDAAKIGDEGPRKRFVVFVLGETARADHFSLNGYLRDTNPRLKKEDIISFGKVTSCGTATATSVPCLFSNLGRQNFSEDLANDRENALDLIQRAGYETTWVDNNTGCKGVCNRVNSVDLSKYWELPDCQNGLCHDEILLKPLRHISNNQSADHFVVLHMVGSHGPTYYMRYPLQFAAFKPGCLTNQLIDCSRDEVINTYDNTILYTDHVLTEIIDFLKTISNKYDTAMVYVSDHGESLGEKGIYLHSLPFSLAPEEQKHVPLLVWMSDSYQKISGIDLKSAKKNTGCALSHDYVFHSLMSLLNIETTDYHPELDIFSPRVLCAN